MNRIIMILFLHFLGDFILQSDKMAQSKSKSNKWLAIHVLCYGLPLLVIGPVYAAVNIGLHFVTDWFTSRATSKLYAAKQNHWFFVVIGFDQFIHAACLMLTLPVNK